MGMDMLDLTFRLEKSFKIKLALESVEGYGDSQRRDIQAGKIHECVCHILDGERRSIPHSSWHRVQLCIAKACGISPQKVKPHSWLVKDLACS